jgi:hypothetical protein
MPNFRNQPIFGSDRDVASARNICNFNGIIRMVTSILRSQCGTKISVSAGRFGRDRSVPVNQTAETKNAARTISARRYVSVHPLL